MLFPRNESLISSHHNSISENYLFTLSLARGGGSTLLEIWPCYTRQRVAIDPGMGRLGRWVVCTSSLPPSKARSETGAKRREVSRWEVQIAFMAKRYAIKSAVPLSSCAVGQGIRVIKRAKLSVHKSVLLRYGLGGRTDGRRMASNARTTTRAQSEAHTALYPVTIKQARVSGETLSILSPNFPCRDVPKC